MYLKVIYIKVLLSIEIIIPLKKNKENIVHKVDNDLSLCLGRGTGKLEIHIFYVFVMNPAKACKAKH